MIKTRLTVDVNAEDFDKELQKYLQEKKEKIKMTEQFLIDNNYKIQNAKITSVDLSMKDHGCLTLKLVLEGSGWGCVFGNVSLGNGFLGAKTFKGWEHCGDYLMMLMDTVGVDTFNDMTGKYVRVAFDDEDRAKIIGNLIEDKWFTAKMLGDEV